MSEAGIYRRSSGTVWAGTHIVPGGRDVVAGRLQRFEQRNLGRPVHVVISNIITMLSPAEITRLQLPISTWTSLRGLCWPC